LSVPFYISKKWRIEVIYSKVYARMHATNIF